MKTIFKSTKTGWIIILIIYTTGISCTQGQELPEGFELYVEENNRYSLMKPTDWTVKKRADPGGSEYLVFTSPKDANGFESNVTVVSDTTNKSIGQYTNDLLSRYILLFGTFDLESRDTLRINDVTFGTFVLKYDIEGTAYRMNTVYTIQEHTLYHLNALAPVSKYDKDKGLMERIISSFSITQ